MTNNLPNADIALFAYRVTRRITRPDGSLAPLRQDIVAAASIEDAPAVYAKHAKTLRGGLTETVEFSLITHNGTNPFVRVHLIHSLPMGRFSATRWHITEAGRIRR